jgi:hypothetical protein
MSAPLLRLGSFSFEGLESPERIHIKSRQRLAVHHLASGLSTVDCLGEDTEVVSFQGIFSGRNAAKRIRSVDYLRTQSQPLWLTWGSQALYVLIHELGLDYSSGLWVPYKLSCYVVRSSGPYSVTETGTAFASAAAQVEDVLGLLQGTGISPASDQTAALITLATSDYDVPPPVALAGMQSLVCSINEQISTLGGILDGNSQSNSEFPLRQTPWISDSITNAGLEAVLILARNRMMNVLVSASSVSQQ